MTTKTCLCCVHFPVSIVVRRLNFFELKTIPTNIYSGYDHLILKIEFARPNAPKDPASEGTQFRSGYGKALAQDTKAKVSYASNLTR